MSPLPQMAAIVITTVVVLVAAVVAAVVVLLPLTIRLWRLANRYHRKSLES